MIPAQMRLSPECGTKAGGRQGEQSLNQINGKAALRFIPAGLFLCFRVYEAAKTFTGYLQKQK
jgi:hypothetical protein